jgi:hypothetical protein
MIGLGEGIAIAGIAIAAAPVAITAIRSRMKNTGEIRDASAYPSSCTLHSGIDAVLKTVQGDIRDIKTDIKSLVNRVPWHNSDHLSGGGI